MIQSDIKYLSKLNIASNFRLLIEHLDNELFKYRLGRFILKSGTYVYYKRD